MDNIQKHRDDLEKRMGNFVRAFEMFNLVCYKRGLEDMDRNVVMFAAYVDANKSVMRKPSEQYGDE